nr:hypothetical protein [Hyphomonas sp. Mor2]
MRNGSGCEGVWRWRAKLVRVSALILGYGVVSLSPTHGQENSARFLYLENCGDVEITQIDVEVKKEEGGDWLASGRRWARAPLLRNQAACFDTAGMYGDAPEGQKVRLRLRFADEDRVACDPTRVDKSSKGALRAFGVFGLEHDGVRCRSLLYVDWQPTAQCDGQGQRIRKIQCD